MNTPETALSFAYADDEQVVVVDRSTLEQFACCPAQARFIQTGAVLTETFPALVGSAGHEALSAGVKERLTNPEAFKSDVAEVIFSALRSARPDIQPQVIDAVRPTVWPFVRFLFDHVNRGNILAYDGGEGDKCSQYSADITIGDITLRITSELDLLLATESPEVIREIDYKSGHKRYGIDEVFSAFQFQTHGWLLLLNFPNVQAVQVQVWCTRTNQRSYPVVFDRDKHFRQIDTRIRAAAGEYVRYRNSKPQDAPVWPSVEKCGICSAARYCPAALHTADVSVDPASFLGVIVATEAKLDILKDMAAAYVDATGKDIVLDGVAFGRNKPTSEKKRPAVLYQLKGDTNANHV